MKKANQATPNQRLIDERVRRGWSQQDIADRVGTTPVNVSRWERGATSPNFYFRQQLATLFEKSPEALRLSAQESPSPEDAQMVEQADSQSDLINDEDEQDITSSFPTQKTGIVSSSIDSSKSIPPQQPFALPPAPPPPSAPRRLQTWQSLRNSLTARVIVLTALVLIFVTVLGLFLLNATHQPATKGTIKGTIVPQPTATSNTVSNTDAEPTLATYGVTKGSLILDDPLSVNNTQIGWAVSPPTKALGCHFINGSYDMKEADDEYCLADNPSDAANFVYQIEMTTLQGQWAGIVFRVDDNQGFYYEFLIGPDGSYRVYRSKIHAADTILHQATSTAIHKGYHQTNWLAVKAIGSDISLYVNSQLVYHTQDATYTSGNLGVRIVVDNGQGATEATYRKAKAWSI